MVKVDTTLYERLSRFRDCLLVLKKLCLLLCFLLVGCQFNQSYSLSGEYCKDEILLTINEVEDESFFFKVSRNDRYIEGYAYFKGKHKAIYDTGEDGHTLVFMLGNDIKIKEEGVTYLEVNLSGTYERLK